jgi:2-polyprenyl-3-methyl-5-hydroxy-6-metoxy-1,4-benzoquinol methylase
MSDEKRTKANEEARAAWQRNASFWDEQMGEGNAWVEELIWPATTRLLGPKPGERVLDVACGNGLTSRRLASAGARVVAVDFSMEMIELARRRASPGEEIEYAVLDATDYEALLALGPGSFDAVLCSMALFDMARIEPLFRAAGRLLRPGGRLVCSTLHPCFNSPFAIQCAELEDREGEFVTTHSIKVSRYLSPAKRLGAAIVGQPEPHPYFHRSLTDLLGAAFAAGLVLDGFEERAFPPDCQTGDTPLSWGGRYSELPPVVVLRFQLS